MAQQAEIYFDYNFPIITNIAQTNFQALSVGEFGFENSISIYPNPTNSFVNLTSRHVMESIKIFDIQGRLIVQKVLNTTQTSINISNYENGVYFIEANSPSGSMTERFIKN